VVVSQGEGQQAVLAAVPVYWSLRKRMRLRELADTHQLDVTELSRINQTSPQTNLRKGTLLRLR
jgi:hypothetical protein